jgi:hypothetical protein
VYRKVAGEGADSWHGEVFGYRMIAISLDLSERPYAGGALEIRDRSSHQLLHRTGGSEPGDAMLVRLAPLLQHRVTAVGGESPRTVYAGRFMLLRSSTQSELAQPATRGGGRSER